MSPQLLALLLVPILATAPLIARAGDATEPDRSAGQLCTD
jgi:hypothetical protein